LPKELKKDMTSFPNEALSEVLLLGP